MADPANKDDEQQGITFEQLIAAGEAIDRMFKLGGDAPPEAEPEAAEIEAPAVTVPAIDFPDVEFPAATRMPVDDARDFAKSGRESLKTLTEIQSRGRTRQQEAVIEKAHQRAVARKTRLGKPIPAHPLHRNQGAPGGEGAAPPEEPGAVKLPEPPADLPAMRAAVDRVLGTFKALGAKGDREARVDAGKWPEHRVPLNPGEDDRERLKDAEEHARQDELLRAKQRFVNAFVDFVKLEADMWTDAAKELEQARLFLERSRT